MRISAPVTSETSGGRQQTYFVQLAKEIESALRQPGFCEFLVLFLCDQKTPPFLMQLQKILVLLIS